MTHFSCIPCRVRTLVDGPCPACGAPCVRVGDPADVVGFRLADADEWLIAEIRRALAPHPPRAPGAT